ncbi:hypothetical protein ACU4GD_40615 [Cupriavidus basilensis]
MAVLGIVRADQGERAHAGRRRAGQQPAGATGARHGRGCRSSRVNIASPLDDPDGLDSPAAVTQQMVTILMNQNVGAQKGSSGGATC